MLDPRLDDVVLDLLADIARTAQTIVAVGESPNKVNMPTMTAPIVAPMIGIRSKNATSTASVARRRDAEDREDEERREPGHRGLRSAPAM